MVQAMWIVETMLVFTPFIFASSHILTALLPIRFFPIDTAVHQGLLSFVGIDVSALWVAIKCF